MPPVDGQHADEPFVPILVCGGGLAGLTAGIVLQRWAVARGIVDDAADGAIVGDVGADASGGESALRMRRQRSTPTQPFVTVCESRKMSEGYDLSGTSGSGMSVIGHSLVLLRAVGLDLSTATVGGHPAGAESTPLGFCADDVSLRSAFRAHPASVLFQVPTKAADPELAAQFGGSVQVNVHRGELHASLHQLFVGECGGHFVCGKRLVDIKENAHGRGVTVVFADGSRQRCLMLIAADGVHSAARRHVLRLPMGADTSQDPSLRDSGYSCWRGMVSDSRALSDHLGGKVMLKTVVSPPQRSFTCGTASGERRFWLVDVGGKERPRELRGAARRNKLLAENSDVVNANAGQPLLTRDMLLHAMAGFTEDHLAVVRATDPSRVLLTDVYDGRVSQITRFGRGPVVCIGDAAHPVVHHFGQGACMAFEDAFGLCESLDTEWLTFLNERQLTTGSLATFTNFLQEGGSTRSVKRFDSWTHWLRCSAILLMSRWCGALYMSPHTWFTHPFLLICLSWPFSALFTIVVRVLLFGGNSHLRQFAASAFSARRQ